MHSPVSQVANSMVYITIEFSQRARASHVMSCHEDITSKWHHHGGDIAQRYPLLGDMHSLASYLANR